MIYFKTSWKTFFSSFILEIEKHCFMSVSIVALQPQIALLFWFVQLLFLGFFFFENRHTFSFALSAHVGITSVSFVATSTRQRGLISL